jgi:hypothetical protein
MEVDKPTAMQIVVAWRDNKWVVLRNASEVGAYAYRAHAMDMARTLAAAAAAERIGCYMLVRERDGSWDERPCPRPAPDDRDAASA